MAKILIVDDEGDLRTLFGLCFLRAGHSIVVANDGEAGLALLRRLRADGHADLPVLVLTASADQQAAARAAGADAFLVKPVLLSQLGAVAERLLAARHAPA